MGSNPATQAFPGRTETYDSSRPLSAIIIGAGIAGIGTAALLQAKVPNLTLTIFEQHTHVGGTWWENRYPGVRCDVPSHSYQLSFAPNPRWSQFYAGGAEIQAYYEGVARDHGLERVLQLRHTVLSADWDADAGQWIVEVRDLAKDTTRTERANFLVSATGRLNTATLPDWPGLADFSGPVVHTARWPAGLEDSLQGKRVAVVGNGASGMQVLPTLLDRCGVQHVVHVARTRNWVSAAFNGGLARLDGETGSTVLRADDPGGRSFSEAERDVFAANPETYLAFRRRLDATFHGGLRAVESRTIGTEASTALRRELTELITTRVAKSTTLNASEQAALVQRLLPDYAPLCKRLTPAPRYIEALADPERTTFVSADIARVATNALETTDGRTFAVDAIVAATGFPPRDGPAFPLRGRSGVDLRDLWRPGGAVGHPRTYFGVMVPQFPNYFVVLQTQGTALGGTVPVQCEQTAAYIAQCIRKVQAQGYVALEPSEAATADFDAIVDNHFADKTTADGCRSWWQQAKGHVKTSLGAPRVTVSWPGSGHHKWDISRFPRWEDFEFERRSDCHQNRFAYFGNGLTKKEEEADPTVLTAYLKQGQTVDLRTWHEGWTNGY